ncbi:phosphatase PAP2 family protein [Neorhizobium sp. DAR64872/K0K18]|uniref:phosphatase PAP2 family protein n=1 Tax=Neorhizobium sp. DAR64872/K0K18 TaxID=3421958 RepID=UPI003D279E40
MVYLTSRSNAKASKFNGYLLAGTVTALGLSSVLFLAMPEIDVKFSRLFYHGRSFPMAHFSSLQLLRALNDWIGGIILLMSLVLLSVEKLRRRLRVSKSDALVPILTYGIGTWAVVNATLKETFGRARPRSIEEFGGTSVFTKVWEMSEACASNCSFTSGEAAGAAAMLSVMFILPKTTQAIRVVVGVSISILAAAISLNRVAFGAHFLSDIVLSALIVVSIMLLSKLLLDRVAETAQVIAPNRLSWQHASNDGTVRGRRKLRAYPSFLRS